MIRKIKKDDDVYTIDAFLVNVQDGSFINDDGHGYYSNGLDYDSDNGVYPSDVKNKKPREGFSHVIWFNR